MAVPNHLSVPATGGRRRRCYAVGALAAVLALTACGGGGEGGDTGPQSLARETPKVEADPKLAEMVPQDIRDQGTIKVGTDATYAPAEFVDVDGTTVIGFDVALFNAVAARLDLKTTWEKSKFGTIVEGVETGKYDVGVSSFTINEDRMKQVNMVSYYNVGTQWFTAKGNPANVDPDNACGKKIAVQKDTVQVPDIKERSRQCVEAGKPEITINQYQGQDQATASITSGKNDAGLADMPVAVYAVEKTNGKLETLGKQYEAAPYGALVPKDDTKFAEAISAGYQSIIDDGTYEKILATWDLDDQGTINKSEVNPDVGEDK